jgi:hypothetical protein
MKSEEIGKSQEKVTELFRYMDRNQAFQDVGTIDPVAPSIFVKEDT